MGAVYEARHTTTGRRVALKVISRELAHKPDVAARFEREARAAGAIDSEHVAQILDVDHDQELNVPFLVMEFLEGRDLDATLEEVGALPYEVVLRIGKEACLGLEKAHAQGVIHRDIKPANLFLSERDRGQLRVKLLDFGIAKLLGNAESPGNPKLTRTGMLVGSPLYMSPEQARGSKELGVSADIWSLGVVLYQALVGSTPINNTEALGELIIALCTEPPPPIRSRAPWVPEEVATVVERALKMEPSERYASAKEMAEALSSLPAIVPFLTKELMRPVQRGEAAAPAQDRPIERRPAGGVALTVPAVPVGVLTAVAPTDKTPTPAVTPTERTPPKIDLVAPAAAPAPPPVEPGPARPWVGPTKLSGAATSEPSEADIQPPLRYSKTAATVTPKSNLVPLGLGAAALVAAGAFGLMKLSESKSAASSATASSESATKPASSSAAASSSATSAPATSSSAKSNSAVAALEGRWKSESGKLYDAVLVEGRIEFRISEKAQFASQGYAASEVRFVLEPVDPEGKRFIVRDHLRPAMKQPAFENGVSPASCLLIAKEVGGQPLTAERLGDGKLRLRVASFTPPESQLVLTGGRLSRCQNLSATAVQQGAESVLQKQ